MNSTPLPVLSATDVLGGETPRNVLLMLLPYWSPVVPPAGLCRIKSYLESRGHRARVVDFNSKKESLSFYYGYHAILEKYIPGGKRGNLKNLGNDLMEYHIMAYVLKGEDEPRYEEHIRGVVHSIFQVAARTRMIEELDAEIRTFLAALGEYLEFLLEAAEPHVVGLTLYKTTLPLSIYTLRHIKALDPRIVTAVGGGIFVDTLNQEAPPFPGFLEQTRDCIDKVVIGDGERAMELILAGRVPDDQRVINARSLPGTPEKLWPVPDFSDFNVFKYSHLVATGSTGCPFECSFCNELNFYGRFARRDAELVHQEMSSMSRANHNRRLFFMTDSLLNPGVDELCSSMILRDSPYYMDTYFRASKQAARPEKCLFWRKGGLYRVRMGLESGSQRMLDLMDKKLTLQGDPGVAQGSLGGGHQDDDLLDRRPSRRGGGRLPPDARADPRDEGPHLAGRVQPLPILPPGQQPRRRVGIEVGTGLPQGARAPLLLFALPGRPAPTPTWSTSG
ncbi:MAG: hypothetical protein U0790_22830 [Isosphaeraceae bacterium]